jgi:hypothetical protein
MNPLNCKEVATKMALGDLSKMRWKDRFLVRFHMAICWVCRKYERQIKLIGRAFAVSIETRQSREDISKFRERLIQQFGQR